MIEEVRVTATHCVCDLCGHDWLTLAKRLPEKCPVCYQRKWNGGRKLGRPKVDCPLEIPKPQRMPI